VVLGGGALARQFIGLAKDLGLDMNAQDEVAISCSRLFAQLFLKRLGAVGCSKVAVSLEEAEACIGEGKITVMGGLRPGITTDTVATLLAEKPSNSRTPDKGPNKALGLSSRDPLARSRQETADYSVKRKQYTDALVVYRTKNSTILSERMKLMQVFLELKAELDGLEEAEKWLLLSMAIRNQSSLLGFMQVKEGSNEELE